MTTLIRVKRRLGEEPADSIMVRSKRRRVEGEGQEEDGNTSCAPPTVLQRVATVDVKEDSLLKHEVLQEYRRGWQLRSQYKRLGGGEGWREASRREAKERGKESRQQVFAAHRTDLDPPGKDSPGREEAAAVESDIEKQLPTPDQIKFYDAELNLGCVAGSGQQEGDVITVNGVPLESTKYVYDIYYSPETVDWMDYVCEVQRCDLALDCEEEEQLEDDDDENDEDNWRNDYPEEEDDDDDEGMDGSYFVEDGSFSTNLRPARRKEYDSDESYDAEDYFEDDGDCFDDEGNLLHPMSLLGSRLAKTTLCSSSESD